MNCTGVATKPLSIKEPTRANSSHTPPILDIANQIFKEKEKGKETEAELDLTDHRFDFSSFLPVELIIYIFQFLVFKSLANVQLVCKTFHAVGNESSLVNLKTDFIIEQAQVLAKDLPPQKKTWVLYQIFETLIEKKNLPKAQELALKLERNSYEELKSRCDLAVLMAEQNCGTEANLLLTDVCLEGLDNRRYPEVDLISYKLNSLLSITNLLATKNPSLASRALDEAMGIIKCNKSEPYHEPQILTLQYKLKPPSLEEIVAQLSSCKIRSTKMHLLAEVAKQDFQKAFSLATANFEGMDQPVAFYTAARAQPDPEYVERALIEAEKKLNAIKAKEFHEPIEKRRLSRKIALHYTTVNWRVGLEKLNLLPDSIDACFELVENCKSLDRASRLLEYNYSLYDNFRQREFFSHRALKFLVNRLSHPSCRKLFLKFLKESNFSIPQLMFDLPQNLDASVAEAIRVAIEKARKIVILNSDNTLTLYLKALSTINPNLALIKAKQLNVQDESVYCDISLNFAKQNQIHVALTILRKHVKDNFQKAVAFTQLFKFTTADFLSNK